MPQKKQNSKTVWIILAASVLTAGVVYYQQTLSGRGDGRTGPDTPELITDQETLYEVLEVLDEGYRAKDVASGEETTLFIIPDAVMVFGEGIGSLSDVSAGDNISVSAYRAAANGIVAQEVAFSSPAASPEGASEPSSTVPPRQ